MLDLDARVHLHEVERTVLVEQHLDGAGADVIDGLRSLHRCFTHLLAQFRGHRRARRFFDQFLVTTLHRTIALAEVDDAPVTVAHDLEFDVARPREVFLDVDVAVAERRERL